MSLRSLTLAFALLLSVLCPAALWAQEGAVERQPYLDLRRYYIGFRLGLHLPDVRITNSGAVNSLGGQLWADSPVWHPGFSIGVIGGVTLVPQLELRLLPTLHLGDVPVAYTDGSQEVEHLSLRTSSLQLPLELKWAAVRWGNYRPFVAAGGYAALPPGPRGVAGRGVGQAVLRLVHLRVGGGAKEHRGGHVPGGVEVSAGDCRQGLDVAR